MAVKKSAKKVAKKAPAKKAVAKRVVKKVAKKAPAKKAVARRVVKKVAKKAPAKRVVKKVAKKAPAKRVVKKVAKKATKKAATRTPQRIIIPPVEKSVATISSTPIAKSVPVSTPAAKSSTNSTGSSSRVIVTVIAGIALLAIIVISRNHNSTTTSTTPSTSPSASVEASSPAATADASMSASPATTMAADGTHAAPVGIVAHYTATGATIFYGAPTGVTGLTNFNIEIASNGGAWKLVSTVPATQLSLDITKGAVDGWSSFRVSAVYSDGMVIAGKIFGLPGQYS